MSSTTAADSANLIEIEDNQQHLEELEEGDVEVEGHQEVNIDIEDEVDQVEAVEDEEEDERENEPEKSEIVKAQFPISRIRKLMKIDCNLLVNKEALFLTAIAAELFISQVAQNSGKITAKNKKKTLSLQHLKTAISEIPAFDFLEGSIPGVDI